MLPGISPSCMELLKTHPTHNNKICGLELLCYSRFRCFDPQPSEKQLRWWKGVLITFTHETFVKEPESQHTYIRTVIRWNSSKGRSLLIFVMTFFFVPSFVYLIVTESSKKRLHQNLFFFHCLKNKRWKQAATERMSRKNFRAWINYASGKVDSNNRAGIKSTDLWWNYSDKIACIYKISFTHLSTEWTRNIVAFLFSILPI